MVVQKTVMSNIFGVFGKSKKKTSECKSDKMCLPSVEKIIMKGFRITCDSDMSTRKGIACQSIEDLKSKVASKFSTERNIKIFTEDGTEIDEDEYLMSLPNNSLLVFSRNKVWQRSQWKDNQ